MNTEQPINTLPRDWEMLTAWLEAEWRGLDANEQPYHAGYYEGLAFAARIMRDSPPAEREGCLYRLCGEALTSPSDRE